MSNKTIRDVSATESELCCHPNSGYWTDRHALARARPVVPDSSRAFWGERSETSVPRLGLTSGHGECPFMGSSDSPLGCQCYRAPSHRINTKLSETARQMIRLRVSLGLSISLPVQNRIMFTSICEKWKPKCPTPTHNMFVSFSTLQQIIPESILVYWQLVTCWESFVSGCDGVFRWWVFQIAMGTNGPTDFIIFRFLSILVNIYTLNILRSFIFDHV